MAVVFTLTGRVPKKRVKWCSKLEHEYITNYKILQDVFKKLGVEQVRVDFGNWRDHYLVSAAWHVYLVRQLISPFLFQLLVERQFFMVHFIK